MKSVLISLLALASASSALVARQKVYDPRYACKTAADCAVVNHGNCCGYYPVCAQPGSTWTAREACPGGGASVCGWPSITSCGCIGGYCYGLQNGNVVRPPME